MIVTLGVWLAMLLLVRFTPSIEGTVVSTPAAKTEEDEVVVPVSAPIRSGGGGKS